MKLHHLMVMACVAANAAGCDGSRSTRGDADSEDDPAPDVDPVTGCLEDGDCTVGVDYRDEATCGEPLALRLDHVEDQECITALGEEPGGGCVDCVEDVDAGRRGRLMPGQEWLVTCEESTCAAEPAPCMVGECDPDVDCITVLDCFLTYTCVEGHCVSGCDTGMDCRPSQVCVREPPDASLGRCVNT